MTNQELNSLPPRKIVSILTRQVFERYHKIGRDKLPLEMKYFALAVELDTQITNGGISQYFTNSTGKDYKLALRALEEIGADIQKNIVLKWLKRLPRSVHPDDRNEVGSYVFSKPELMTELAIIDKEYFDSRPSLNPVLVEYVKRHAKTFDIS